MESILSLCSWQLILFSLGISAVIYIFRTMIEYILSRWKSADSKLWNDLVLPIMPAIMGCISAAILDTYPYPENVSTMDARIVFGLVAGFFSGLVYRIVKKMIIQQQLSSSTLNNSTIET